MTQPGEPSRISFELPRDISTRLNVQIPFGMKGLLISKIVELLTEILEQQTTEEARHIIIAAVIEKDLVLARRKK
jgi:hypothetical protein